jgi:hypothetical protein
MINKRTTEMNWKTIYITGKEGFKEEVRKKLEHSDLKHMPGNLGTSTDVGTDDMYWLDDQIDLRTFKEEVSGKLVWKYRLRFYESLETFLQNQETQRKANELTPEDLALIEEMRHATTHE